MPLDTYISGEDLTDITPRGAGAPETARFEGTLVDLTREDNDKPNAVRCHVSFAGGFTSFVFAELWRNSEGEEITFENDAKKQDSALGGRKATWVTMLHSMFSHVEDMQNEDGDFDADGFDYYLGNPDDAGDDDITLIGQPVFIEWQGPTGGAPIPNPNGGNDLKDYGAIQTFLTKAQFDADEEADKPIVDRRYYTRVAAKMNNASSTAGAGGRRAPKGRGRRAKPGTSSDTESNGVSSEGKAGGRTARRGARRIARR